MSAKLPKNRAWVIAGCVFALCAAAFLLHGLIQGSPRGGRLYRPDFSEGCRIFVEAAYAVKSGDRHSPEHTVWEVTDSDIIRQLTALTDRTSVFRQRDPRNYDGEGMMVMGAPYGGMSEERVIILTGNSVYLIQFVPWELLVGASLQHELSWYERTMRYVYERYPKPLMRFGRYALEDLGLSHNADADALKFLLTVLDFGPDTCNTPDAWVKAEDSFTGEAYESHYCGWYCDMPEESYRQWKTLLAGLDGENSTRVFEMVR